MELLTEMVLMTAKQPATPGELLDGVLNQVPPSTTMLMRLNGGLLQVDLTLPKQHLYYQLKSRAEADDVIRALRHAAQPIGSRPRANVPGWDEALPAVVDLETL
jgi:hypothetical protein